MMKIKPLSAALVAAGVLGVSSASALDLVPGWFKSKPAPAQGGYTAVSDVTAPAAVAPLTTQSVPNYRAIVKTFGPAVVGVTVAGTHKASAEEQGLPPGLEDDPFFKFFKGMPGLQQRGQRGGQVPFRGLGSGFIISSDGLILTNAHVVREAKDVTVKLSDRREFSAKVLGSDATTDIAVLRIDARDLPVVRLGDPKGLEVGDPVLAIGAPYGLEQTATQGIVSAKGRSLPGD
ncbi:MAG TPA: trypsin-like peptidase domain-containing protein, partial [Burkholderiaceae bacterium]|nr:trypsin-like peptidase domain-containing protein [Burkholderiaceae bacterium]